MAVMLRAIAWEAMCRPSANRAMEYLMVCCSAELAEVQFELLILLPLRTFGFIASGMEDELSMVEDTLHRIILRRGASLK